jgi:hypothetical protein
MVVYGGVWWFMVVCPFVNSHAGQGEGRDTLPASAGPPQYDAPALPPAICNLKRNETKKYRDAVCEFLNRELGRELQLKQVPMDGNCFFESVSTAMAHFDVQLLISAEILRSRIVEWLVAAKVRTPHPYTTIFGQQLKPVHHLTPPRYRTECMERLGLNA